MSEEVLEIFEKKIDILRGIQEILIEKPEYNPVFDNSDPKEKRQIILNQISDRQEKSLKHLKHFKENIKISKDHLKEIIPEIEGAIARIENEEAISLAKKGLDELKLAYASLYEQN